MNFYDTVTFIIFAHKKMLLEACVESFEQAVLAEKRGAHRIELCSDLSQGGLTPDFQLVLKTASFLSIPVMVMIRPRGGDFVYSKDEINLMVDQIGRAKKAGAAGIVFGLLTNDNQIDLHNTRLLVKAAKPLPVTFHKAIDLLDDPASGVAELKGIEGLRRILTSGGKRTATEGHEKISEMTVVAGEDLTIIVAGKVTSENIRKIKELTGGEEFHGRRIVGELVS
jgi:copper homeostasis protein